MSISKLNSGESFTGKVCPIAPRRNVKEVEWQREPRALHRDGFGQRHLRVSDSSCQPAMIMHARSKTNAHNVDQPRHVVQEGLIVCECHRVGKSRMM